ncbi:MAG: amino acid racemase [Candidatus Bathyarchaeota archaeon]
MGEKIIGILGGMGPEATADLYMRIIRATKVQRDQNHRRVIIDSNAKIPDRTAAIKGKGPSPLPMLVETGLNLQRAGADFIIIPCNTAHHFHGDLQKKLKVPVLHMIGLSAEKTKMKHPGVNRAGLLASDGTLMSRLYQQSWGKQGIEIIEPGAETQRDVMKSIYQFIKRGDLELGRKLLYDASLELIEAGAEAVICGCTEVSIVLHDGDLTVPVLDPMQDLAEEAVRLSAGP